MPTTFTHADLLACVPFLRPKALVLTRNRANADDLVQETVLRALRNAQQFEAGSNLKAWMYTILRHAHFNEVRRAYNRSRPLDELNEPSVPPTQGASLEFCDFLVALRQIRPEGRDALLQVAVDGLSYAQVSKNHDCPIGTVKSRVTRARQELRRLYEIGPAAQKDRTVELSTKDRETIEKQNDRHSAFARADRMIHQLPADIRTDKARASIDATRSPPNVGRIRQAEPVSAYA
jgi:RNA polymerase sigma-70 factor (ECF subfamily)